MNPLPPPRRERTWRVAFPVTLLVVGVAASCWLACVGEPGPTEAQQIETLRVAMETDLRRALPPANTSTPPADRLRVTGSHPLGERFAVMHVVAVGNFDATSARAFALIARRPRPGPFVRVITVDIHSDAKGARTLVASFGASLSLSIRRSLEAQFPPPAPSETGAPFRVTVLPGVEGFVDAYFISIVGPFTPESAATMADAVRQLHRATPGETRFFGNVINNAHRPSAKLADFDTAQDK